MKVLIIGAGAIGSLVGGTLSEICDVTMVGRSEHTQAMMKGGLVLLEGSGKREIFPHVMTQVPEGDFDMILVTTKTYDTLGALKGAKPVIKRDTLVILLQNGLGMEDKAAKMLTQMGVDVNLARGVISHSVLIESPGVVRRTGSGDLLFGMHAGKGKDGLNTLVKIFAKAGLTADVVDDISRPVWLKAIINSCVNPLCALVQRPNGALAQDPELRVASKIICTECESVARHYANLESVDAWGKVLEMSQKTATNLNSMLLDIRAHKRTEIDALNGEIIARAKLLGIPVPSNQVIYSMVKSMEPKSVP